MNYNWKPRQQIMSRIQETTVQGKTTLSRKRGIVETMGIGPTSSDMATPEMIGDR
jgi:hypothetical protein